MIGEFGKTLPTLKEHLEMARKVAAKTTSLDKPFPGDKPSGRTPPRPPQ